MRFPCICGCSNTLESDDEPQEVRGREGLWILAWCNEKQGGCSYHGWHRVDEALTTVKIVPHRRLRPSALVYA